MYENLYRDPRWLRSQLDQGISLEQIAARCDVPLTTIVDWAVRKFQIVSVDDIDSRIPDKVRSYRGLKVAVLGSSGFVGQNLVKLLRKKSVNLIEINRSDADLLNSNEAFNCFENFDPDVVVNLAAFVGGIGLNRNNPGLMIHRNLLMSINVLSACQELSIRHIFLGSVCSYPKVPDHIPFREDDLWNGRPEPTNEPYGVAKKTIGFMMDCLWQQYKLLGAYLIPTNMYGPYDDFSDYSSHVIPAIIMKFLDAKRNKHEEVVLWGDGSPSRDFLYVGDCCEAICQAIKKCDRPVPINIGTGIETKISDLATTIAGIVGFDGRIRWDTDKPNGQPRRVLDVSRAKRILGFKPKTDLAAGIRKTLHWYRTHCSQRIGG